MMNKITKTMLISAIMNTLLSFIKIIFGFIGKSTALIADGVHSFSDLATDFIAILGGILSRKPADEKHPFGHGKIEYVTSLGIGLLVLCLGFTLIYKAFATEIQIPSLLISLVSLFTIISNDFLAHYICIKGKEYKNNILIASGKESKADVYSSIFVFVSIVLMQFADRISLLGYANLMATFVISLFIIHTGYSILKDNISILLEEQITDENYKDSIQNSILSYEEIKELQSFYILRYGPYYKLIATVIMDKTISLEKAHYIIDDIEEKLKKKDTKIQYVFIHMEPEK